MMQTLRGTIVRLTLFTCVCTAGTFALLLVYAQLRFEPTKTYRAEFTSVTGLADGQFVRIAGVEVGKVKRITITPANTALVEFSADDSVLLTHGTRAVIRYDNLVGDRYLELQDGPGSTAVLKPGDTIPIQRTAPALDLDALIGGFRPLFRALNPDQVNALSGQLVQAFQGQGATINSFLSQAASLTTSLADRDQLIGEVVANLNSLLGSLAEQSGQFDKTVTSLAKLVAGLSARKTDISAAVAATDAAAGSLAGLLGQVRPPFAAAVPQADRAATIALADHDYLDNLLATLPDAYQVLGRQGLYGDYFAFYLCDLVLKVNGKGGQPVYVKLAGQSSGRCTPK
ncbi:MCE family protein [Mycobacterium palustre]|uniref:Mammalian cell entry protein n=1 Tax=Mycobacterium palustre TaxID=153971 RepID=A0A1X1ZY74_9MYCO|nr:MCE family protein [Mycobacterium palustre]MCV7100425.1 MCE family protein [Mycobacterium palustre]ORW31337.1 mammalian cell entry protein [Mycobacterium palustre]